MRCSPVTPDAKVPWVEIEKLPDVSRDRSYFEACTDIDNAWTKLSYPDEKYVPQRAQEQEAIVAQFLLGIKDFVAAESSDWVSYLNAWLGVDLPQAKVVQNPFKNGDKLLFMDSELLDRSSRTFLFKFSTLGSYETRAITASGFINSEKRRLSLSNIESTSFCITPVDLKKHFENQSGYLFRPMSIRTSNRRPNAQELADLGGQWFGYEVHVFDTSATSGSAGLIVFGFGFKPCAGRIQIDLKRPLALRPLK